MPRKSVRTRSSTRSTPSNSSNSPRRGGARRAFQRRPTCAHEKADRRLLPTPDLADGCDRGDLGRPGLAADRLALYAVDSELHLDRGAVALSLHLDGHARRDGRHQGRHAFRGRHLARALPARQRHAQDRLEPVRADLRAGVRLLGDQVRGVRLVSGIRARRTTHAVHFRRLAARRRDLGGLPGRDLRRQYPHPGREGRAMTQAAMSPGMAALVPFFLLTANLMNIGGITDRLVHLSRTMVGNWPGSLAQINVLLSVFFAGISGSSTADAASQSKIFIEAQTKEGYDLSFSIAITAVSAVLAVIIPPSILMIVWGGVLSVSIGALYLAGILPGLLIAAAQMATVHIYAKLYDYPVYPRATFRDFLCSAAQSVPALMTPFIIVGGILLGWFTATESACVAVIYAAVLSIFVYRQMDLKQLYQALAETGRLSAVALFCVGTASAFGWMLAYYQIPRALLANVTAWGMGITEVGFFIALVFLVVGCFLDAIPAIIIVGTTLEPLARSVNMYPVQFGGPRTPPRSASGP